MKDFKGTQGPWNSSFHVFSSRVVVEDSKEQEIASVGLATDEKVIANAALMAAAPDMAAALQEIILVANSRGSETVKYRMIIQEAEAALDKAFGAVDKVKGVNHA